MTRQTLKLFKLHHSTHILRCVRLESQRKMKVQAADTPSQHTQLAALACLLRWIQQQPANTPTQPAQLATQKTR